MTQVGVLTTDCTAARRVESYDPSIGCLAIRSADGWCVVFPTGRVLRRFGEDEYAARNYAMFLNLTNDIRYQARNGFVPA